MKMKIAHYLFKRLEQCGAEVTFGIPGDFALPLYGEQSKYGMKTIVCAHEPGCVFAADAYSRLKGLGAVLTTYGVGGLNMINPVAMAYAEHSPVVVISGAPELQGRLENPAFHHLVKDYGSQQRVFAEVTCATASLTNPESSASEIDRVLSDCLAYKRPGYIEIPRDLTSVEIELPEIVPKCSLGPLVDKEALDESAGEIVTAFGKAKRPVLFVGVGIRRYGLVDAAIKIAEQWGMVVVSSVMGKASFPESHPQYAGMYMGQMGADSTRRIIDNADLVLAAGVIFSDVNTGFWTSEIADENLVNMQDLQVKISKHTYSNVPLGSLLSHLATIRVPAKTLPVIEKVQTSPAALDGAQELRIIHLIQSLRQLNPKRFSLLADIGDGWFAGLELKTDVFMAPGYYASMGFAVPGAIGAALAAPELRPVVLVGDGAFQMTGNELSTLVANKLTPIIIVLNNGYYKMLSALDGHREYYNLNNWDYVQYAEALGCRGARATTPEEFSHALGQALACDQPYLIEAILQKDDHAPIMQKIKDFIAKSGGNGVNSQSQK